jgi:TPR repeat protein
MGLFDFIFGSSRDNSDTSLDSDPLSEVRRLAEREGNGAKFIRLALADIDAGKPAGYLVLSNLYQRGFTVLPDARDFPKSAEKALMWKLHAAEKGNTDAQTSLGFLYYFGNTDGENIVRQRDYSEAIKWFTKAANSDSFYSLYALGEISFKGIGTPLDYKAALLWFERSINHRYAKQFGFYDAAVRLAEIFAKGLGTDVNLVEAQKWAFISRQNPPTIRELQLASKLSRQEMEAATTAASAWSKGASVMMNVHPAYLLTEGCGLPA